MLANAISISVRERRQELAVMKVLGFRPGQILLLVLGESVLLGLFGRICQRRAGVMTSSIGASADWKFPIAFFDCFFIPGPLVAWGAAVMRRALAGSLVPAWFACKDQAGRVFRQGRLRKRR